MIQNSLISSLVRVVLLITIVACFVCSSLTPIVTNAQTTTYTNEQQRQLLIQLITRLQQLIADLQAKKSAPESAASNQSSSSTNSDSAVTGEREGLSLSFALHNSTQQTPLNSTDSDDQKDISVIVNKDDRFSVAWEAIGYDSCEVTSTRGDEYTGVARTVTGWPAPRPGTSVTIWLTCEKDQDGPDIIDTRSINVTTSDPEGVNNDLG